MTRTFFIGYRKVEAIGRAYENVNLRKWNSEFANSVVYQTPILAQPSTVTLLQHAAPVVTVATPQVPPHHQTPLQTPLQTVDHRSLQTIQDQPRLQPPQATVRVIHSQQPTTPTTLHPSSVQQSSTAILQQQPQPTHSTQQAVQVRY